MTQFTFPREYLNRMQNMLCGEDEAFFTALKKDPGKALRINPLKSVKPADLTRSYPLYQNVPWEPMGFTYEETFSAGKHPFHEAGVYYIQEPSAMAPVSYLDVKENERILDLCAAPGGKSTQIAGRMKGFGLLISNEIVEKRARILSENIERMGVTNAIVTVESPDVLSLHFPSYFDKILVDAPCSGEGMFRKNCEAIGEWSPDNVKLCARRQDDILNCADIMLKPGGCLVYSTCTFAPDEDEGTIVRFLSQHPGYRLAAVKKHEGMAGGKEEFLKYAFAYDVSYDDFDVNLSDCIRIWPHKSIGEGHFMAVLIKGDEQSDEAFCKAKGGIQKGLSAREVEMFFEFQRNSLRFTEGKEYNTDNSIFIRFGDNLYRLPKDAPNLSGLRVERAGLHLGTFLKNRFEPAHALSHSLQMTEAVNIYNLAANNPEVAMYINGQALRPSLENGNLSPDGYGLRINNEKSPWVLVCVDGFSLGWGKYVGGTIKNHYPKGLRK